MSLMLFQALLRKAISDPARRLSQRWNFLSTLAAPSKQPAPEDIDDEKLVLPSLKKLVNQTTALMQMPDMTRKYAVSTAPLIPSYFLGKLQLVRPS